MYTIFLTFSPFEKGQFYNGNTTNPTKKIPSSIVLGTLVLWKFDVKNFKWLKKKETKVGKHVIKKVKLHIGLVDFISMAIQL